MLALVAVAAALIGAPVPYKTRMYYDCAKLFHKTNACPWIVRTFAGADYCCQSQLHPQARQTTELHNCDVSPWEHCPVLATQRDNAICCAEQTSPNPPRVFNDVDQFVSGNAGLWNEEDDYYLNQSEDDMWNIVWEDSVPPTPTPDPNNDFVRGNDASFTDLAVAPRAPQAP
ncbi:MAG: hypothetical protein ACPGR8_13510 [Limisphaerales bacterium]